MLHGTANGFTALAPFLPIALVVLRQLLVRFSPVLRIVVMLVAALVGTVLLAAALPMTAVPTAIAAEVGAIRRQLVDLDERRVALDLGFERTRRALLWPGRRCRLGTPITEAGRSLRRNSHGALGDTSANVRLAGRAVGELLGGTGQPGGPDEPGAPSRETMPAGLHGRRRLSADGGKRASRDWVGVPPRLAQTRPRSFSGDWGLGRRANSERRLHVAKSVPLRHLRGAMAWLRITVRHPSHRRPHDFGAEGIVVVGREETADVAISDPNVSTCHLIFEREGDGWLVTDRGSTNGTRMGGLSLPQKSPRRVPPRCSMRIGVGRQHHGAGFRQIRHPHGAT